MSRSVRAIRGVAYNFLGRGASIVITFVLTPIVIARLGAEGYGVWAIVLSLTNYYGLLSLGLRGAGTKYIAEFQANDDRPALNSIVVTSLLINCALSLIALAVVLLFTWGFPYVFDSGSYRTEEVRWVVLLTGMKVCIELATSVFAATLRAFQRFELCNATAVGFRIVEGLTMVALLYAGGGIVGMAAVVLGVGTLRHLTEGALALSLLGGIRLTRSSVQSSTVRTLFRFGLLHLSSTVVWSFCDSAGRLLTALMIGPIAVAAYAVAEQITKQAALIASVSSEVTFPLVSQLQAQKRLEELRHLAILIPRLLLVVGAFLTAVVMVLGHRLLEVWIGSEMATRSYPVLCVLSIALMGRMAYSQGLRPILQGMNELTKVNRVTIIEAVLTLGLGVPLLKAFGVVGMGWAILMTQLVVAWCLTPLITARLLDLRYAQLMIRSLGPATLASVPGVIVTIGLHIAFPEPSLLGAVAQVLVAFATFALFGWLICFTAQERQEVIWAFFIKTRQHRHEAHTYAETAGTREIALATTSGPELRSVCKPRESVNVS